MATYSRRERMTRHVEYTVPATGGGAPWAEVMKAVRAAHQELWKSGEVPDGRDASDDTLMVTGDGEQIIVAYTVDEGDQRGAEPAREAKPHGWALWFPHGGLHSVAPVSLVGDDHAEVWTAIGTAQTSIPAPQMQSGGWHLDPLTRREFDFLSHVGMVKAFAPDGSRDAWRLVARDAS